MVDHNLANKTVLYAGISGGKKLPFLPIEPITQEKASELPSYVEAKYDENGQLTTMTKFIGNKVYFIQTIAYENYDIKEVLVKNANGEITRKLEN